MKILILGANGNLGTQLMQVFADNNEVVGWDREDFNILDFKNLEEKISALSPELIINAVAYNAVDKCEASEEEFEIAKKINGEAVKVLADIATKIKSILIHYSTDYVFDGENDNGYAEDALPCPINNYGKSKLAGEKAIVNQYLIRTSKLFGPQGKSELAKPSFFDTMLKIAKDKEEIEVVNEEKSCFTYTPDLASATKKLIDEKMPTGIYHVINPGVATWFEACQKLFALAGIEKKIIPVSSEKFPRPARRPKSSQLLNSKLPPLRNYNEALQEYLTQKKSA